MRYRFSLKLAAIATILALLVAALDAQKRAALTPAQIVSELGRSIPLPEPVTLDQPLKVGEPGRGTTYRVPASAANQAPDHASQASGDRPAATSRPAQTLAESETPPHVLIPRTDLKPPYDFTLDCQACKAKLSAAQNDLADEKTKTAALTKERDDEGGSAWRRLGRAAKWFLIGAAAGAVVAKGH